MNLLTDAWLPVTLSSGRTTKICPWQITALEDPVLELAAPRADFQGALYQFLIGLLQTCFAPDDEDEWLRYWQGAPSTEELKAAFMKVATAFELHNPGGPAFLQDFDMPEGEVKPLASLLIDSPGGKTLKDNLDHFVKDGSGIAACEACTATALFTLQTNAPSGGVGHRTGLRGGGPLTTLLIPEIHQVTLWQKIWINVLSLQEWQCQRTTKPTPDVFPWMAPVRSSDKKNSATLPTDVSPLQMYWGTPRRIRLESDIGEGLCGVCGELSSHLYSKFRTKNYGVNYEGPWLHPLTPYRFDSSNEKPPLSLKGQKGGIGYRHWLGLTWKDPNNGDRAALNVRNFHNERYFLIRPEHRNTSLWCFGYDMDNMKARCWYETTLPILNISAEQREVFTASVAMLIQAANEVVREARSQIKSAWFSRPKDIKGDFSMVDSSFWEATETGFYEQLRILTEIDTKERTMPSTVATQWLKLLRINAIKIFDEWAITGNAEDLDMKRIMRSRRSLHTNLKNLKAMKFLSQISESEEEARDVSE